MSDEPPVKRTGRKDRTPRQRHEAKVVSIFGEGAIEPPMDPDGIRPESQPIRGTEGVTYQGANGPRKTPPRKEMKQRVGARWSQVLRDIDEGKITMSEFVKALTTEELVRGKLKAQDGTWKGAPPKWVPAEFHSACMKELLKRGKETYQQSFITAIEVFTAVAGDKGADPALRLKAAQYIWERVEGKVPERVEVSAAEPWEQIIGGIVAEAEDDAIANASRVLNGTGATAAELDIDWREE